LIEDWGNDNLPDPEAEVIRALFDKIQALEAEVNRLKERRGLVPAINNHTQAKDNQLIENFLDGAGI
jgi:serine O-acetyltransferase